MLAEARRSVPSCRFVAAALEEWIPEETPDLLFSNAAFQWVRDHVTVLKRLLATLREGGALAVQVPDNLREPSHVLMLETAASGPWSSKLKGVSDGREVIHSPEHYYDALQSHVTQLEIWRTSYHHPLEGPAAIVDFLSSTALRPFFDPLEESERSRFRTAFEARLAIAYPRREDGKVLFRFPRLFLLAVR
jgi:trans-aconitate 2-methyltransferase